jgi:hypothetical protein
MDFTPPPLEPRCHEVLDLLRKCKDPIAYQVEDLYGCRRYCCKKHLAAMIEYILLSGEATVRRFR